MTSQPNVRIKSYFAPSVVAAIVQAREELGEEALLLNTRKLAGDAGQGYEVVFGLPPESQEPEAKAQRAAESGQGRGDSGLATELKSQALEVAAPEPPPELTEIHVRLSPQEPPALVHPAPAVTNANVAGIEVDEIETDDVAGELEKLHAQIDEIRNLIIRPRTQQMITRRAIPELNDIYNRLLASGVDAAISKDIVDRVEAAIAAEVALRSSDAKQASGAKAAANRAKTPRFDPARLEGLVRAELENRVAIKSRLGVAGEHGAVVVMIGPTGAGKTTSIMKLAASDLAAGRHVRILSLDPSGSGQNHLQWCAGKLGGDYSAVQSVQTLPEMVAQSRANDLVFVDTPGYSKSGDQAMELAAAVIGKIRPADIHLVAPGYMKNADLSRAIRKYEIFRPSRLLATKMDETDTFGSIFSEASRAELALSFLANGTSIPHDIRPATNEDLAALAFENKLAQAQCA